MANIGSWRVTCFDYDVIQDIVIQDIKPNGYMKMISSKLGDTITYYYNKDGLYINDVLSSQGKFHNRGISVVSFEERPFVYDKPTILWLQIEINKLRKKNVEYVDMLTKQSETIHRQEQLMNNYLAKISNLKNKINEQKQ